jgi:2-(1,2-epoxy-1,2-dihydrophenyl)acetyl-CoA isomerase
MKRLLQVSFDNDLQTQLDAEAKGFIACAGTADFREGVDAFMGKRRPHFTGR